jgi:predicted MFS family arabinose efflux permease
VNSQKKKDMKRVLKIIAIPLVGIAIVMSGFVYDVIFAGIPYQDPTPEMQARYEFHSSIAGWILMSGGILFLVGLIAIPFILKNKRTR